MTQRVELWPYRKQLPGFNFDLHVVSVKFAHSPHDHMGFPEVFWFNWPLCLCRLKILGEIDGIAGRIK